MKSLEPLRKAVPCELVMADTGSTDGSRAVAEKYADILFDFPWCDDVAAARNEAHRHARGGWVLSIDADETVQGGERQDIRELLKGNYRIIYRVAEHRVEILAVYHSARLLDESDSF